LSLDVVEDVTDGAEEKGPLLPYALPPTANEAKDGAAEDEAAETDEAAELLADIMGAAVLPYCC